MTPPQTLVFPNALADQLSADLDPLSVVIPETIDELLKEGTPVASLNPIPASRVSTIGHTSEALDMVSQAIYASVRANYMASLQAQIDRNIPEPCAEGFLLVIGDKLDEMLNSPVLRGSQRINARNGDSEITGRIIENYSKRKLVTLNNHDELSAYLRNNLPRQEAIGPKSSDNRLRALHYDPFTKEVSEIEFTPAVGYLIGHEGDRRRLHSTLALAISTSGSLYSLSVKTPEQNPSSSRRQVVYGFADLALVNRGRTIQETGISEKVSVSKRLLGRKNYTREMQIRDVPPLPRYIPAGSHAQKTDYLKESA